MPELTPELIFNLHPKIRWAALSTDKGEVVFVRMRPGLESLSPENADQAFMQLSPMMLQGVCERLAPWAGPVEAIVTSYEKIVLVVRKVDKQFLALTINREDKEILRELMNSLHSLAHG